MKMYKGYNIPEGATGFIAGDNRSKLDAFYKYENGKPMVIAADGRFKVWVEMSNCPSVVEPLTVEPLPVELTIIRHKGCDYIKNALYLDDDKNMVRLLSASDNGFLVEVIGSSLRRTNVVPKLSVIPYELGTITPVDIDSEIKHIIGRPWKSQDDQVEAIKELFK